MQQNNPRAWSGHETLVTQRRKPRASVCQADFERGVIYTVQLNVRPHPKRTKPVQCEAVVEWSVEGNEVTRRVTIGNGGASISGTGQAVRVYVEDVSPATVPPEELEYDVSALIVPGVRATGSTPPMLQPRQSIIVVAAGATQVVPIPEDSGAVSVNASVYNTPPGPIANQEARVYHADSLSGTVYGGYDPRDVEWAPLHTSANELRLQNNSAVQQTYSVTFGIDG